MPGPGHAGQTFTPESRMTPRAGSPSRKKDRIVKRTKKSSTADSAGTRGREAATGNEAPGSARSGKPKKAPPPPPIRGPEASQLSRRDLMLAGSRKPSKAGPPPPLRRASGLGPKPQPDRRSPVERRPVASAPPTAIATASASPGTTADVAAAVVVPGGPGAADIGTTILNRSRTIRASDLAASHNEVRVLGMSVIQKLLQEAVDDSMKHLEREWDESERKRLLEEAEEEFKERLASFEAEKAGLEARATTLQDQLNRAQSLLEEERHRVVRAEQFTVSDAGILELEKRLGRLLDHAIARGGVAVELENDMREVVSRLLDDERERISQKEQEAQNQSISLLERKIQRLTRSLTETDQARKKAERRAQALESAQGGLFVSQNIVEAGLDEDDPNREKKLELLREIMEGNKQVRKFMDEHGIRTESRRKPQLAREMSPENSIGADRGPEGADRDVVTEEVRVSESPGVKAIEVKRVKPPPLERSAGSEEKETGDRVDGSEGEAPLELSEATLALLRKGTGDGEEVDPDDLPWEPGSGI